MASYFRTYAFVVVVREAVGFVPSGPKGAQKRLRGHPKDFSHPTKGNDETRKARASQAHEMRKRSAAEPHVPCAFRWAWGGTLSPREKKLKKEFDVWV